MKIFVNIISTLLLGLGSSLLMSPFFLWWAFYSSYEKFIWTISGPFPFNYAGSSAGVLFGLTGIIIFAIFLIITSQLIKKLSQ